MGLCPPAEERMGRLLSKLMMLIQFGITVRLVIIVQVGWSGLSMRRMYPHFHAPESSR